MLQSGRAQHFADHGIEIARLVGKAGDRCRAGRLLEQRAQRFVGAQVAGLDDQEAVDVAALDERLQRIGVDAPPGQRAHDLAAAEHRHGLQLDADAGRIVLEVGVVEAQHLAALALGQPPREHRGAFAHQAGVGAVEQHRRRHALRAI